MEKEIFKELSGLNSLLQILFNVSKQIYFWPSLQSQTDFTTWRRLSQIQSMHQIHKNSFIMNIFVT